MAGALTHFVVSFLGFLAITFISKNWKYGLAFVIGHLIPDAIRVGVTGIFTETWSLGDIMTKALFWKMDFLHSYTTWVILFAVVFIVLLGLHKFKRIDKKQFVEWFTIDLIFLIGTIAHLVLDHFILETSYWI